ncbi:hypothetical protein [uncultured Alistipes sp.]|jgi:hypothetical protein|uniref:hypothetical protein n=1 Tax=uncultured Alistipes sp. TaxID=538949 RepID=UPI0025FBB3A2|nr:hypothetical protein [uncultured Alistipes sp.]
MGRHNIIWPKAFFAVAALFALGNAGCVRDETADPVDKPGQRSSVELLVPGFETPVTRSIEGDGGEAAVKSVDLLVFDKASTPVLLYHTTADIIRQSPAGPAYKVSFDVELPRLDNAGTVVLVANAASEVLEALNGGGGRTLKPDILSWLRFNTAPENGRYEWKVDPQEYTPIPMYGETAVNGITPGMKITGVELMRMLARIDVENEVRGGVFQLQEILVSNYRTGGYIAPAWNTSTGAILKEGDAGYPYSGNGDPPIPPTAGKPGNSYDNALKYAYTQVGDVPGPLLSGQIYTFEATKDASPADPAQRVCLILKGNYAGTVYYYRVDFTTDKNGSLEPVAVETMPLYRNHKYVVTITAAEGIGYDTFEQALNSTTVLSNLKTTIQVVDMSGIKNIVYDGQYYMGVESRSIDLPWGLNRQVKHRVSSNYHGDWKAEVLESATTRWLRFAGDRTSVTGSDINQSGLDFVVTAQSTPDYVSGRIVFTAGRLRDTLTVRRVPIADMFARSNVVFNYGRLTFAVTEQDNRTIPAWVQGVFFKWGSLVSFAPSGNPYDPAQHVSYCPDGFDPSGWGGGLEGWDKVPYAHTKFGFATPPVTGDDADAFTQYGNSAGYDESTAVGDVCRYISGKEGWIDGRWRLPTYAELDQLYKETGVKTVSKGDFKNLTGSFAGLSSGMSDPMSGWFLGARVTGSTSDSATPPAGTVFLPASGQRYPNGGGNAVHIGAYAYYWSSTPYLDYTVNYLFQSKYGVEFYDADRSYAFPVRCIRDY